MSDTPEKDSSSTNTPSTTPKTKSLEEPGNKDLQIHPRVLHFPPPVNRVITNILKLHNAATTPTAIAFKIKTTRPNRYSVKPHLGLIKPGENIEVLVRLNFQRDPVTNLKDRDKFQVETINLDSSTANNGSLEYLGNLFKTTPQAQIIREKLKCRFAAITRPSMGGSTQTGTSSSGTGAFSTGMGSLAGDQSRGSGGLGAQAAVASPGGLSNRGAKVGGGIGGIAGGEESVEVWDKKVKELEKKNKDLDAARNKLMNERKLEHEGKFMGLSRAVWIMIVIVGIISFVLGAVLF